MNPLEAFGSAVLAMGYLYVSVQVFRDMEARGQPGFLWMIGVWLLPFVSLLAYLVVKRRYPPLSS